MAMAMIALSAAVSMPVVAAKPRIQNLTAQQRAAPDMLVDITFRLVDACDAPQLISVAVSTNSGTEYNVGFASGPVDPYGGSGFVNTERVLRGGCWATWARYCRISTLRRI
jgi:hypothetical protein